MRNKVYIRIVDYKNRPGTKLRYLSGSANFRHTIS